MHKALARQLRRALNLDDEVQITEFLGGIAAAGETGTMPAELTHRLAGLRQLLERIDATYVQYDRDLELRTRSLEMSSEELLVANNKLYEELASREKAIRTLQETANALRQEIGWEGSPESDDNLDNLIELVSGMVSYREESQREIQQAQRALENQKFALDQHAIVSISNIAGDIIYANDRFCQISGYEREELIGRNHRIINSGHHRPEFFTEMWRTITAGKVWQGEICNKAKDGRLYWVAATIVPFLDEQGKPYQYAGIRTDITKQRQAEQEALEAKEAAEAASRSKSDFLANMSHEIRTPMNGVIGMTELVLDTDLTDEQQEYLRIVKSSAESLLTIINDILDFSKIEAGKLHMEDSTFSLADVLSDTLKSLALRAHQRGLEIVCQVDPTLPDWVVGDPGRLRQVLVNLIGNAIKFTEKGEVVIRVEPGTGNDSESIAFSVSDTGIGIPPQKLDHIFEAFAQEDSSTTRRYGGTGLGLTISARLVEMMAGRIWVESEPGRGSTFHFTARLQASSEQPTDTPLFREQLAGFSVLVVDDNAVNRRVLADTLEHWRMKVRVVDSGSAAIEALCVDGQPPTDLVLLDGLMPDMDGLQTAAVLASVPLEQRPTIIMLSSAGLREDSSQWRRLGISAYLVKPVLQVQLLATLLKVLGQTQNHLEPAAQRAEQNPTPGAAMDILLVEDHPVNQKLVLNLLEKWGHRTRLAANGQEALDILALQHFDLILMDMQMPVMDGLEATRRFRAGESGRRTPIVAMTANAMDSDREACLAAGMDDYLAKPVKAVDLQAMIERHRRAPDAAFDYRQAIRQADTETVAIVSEIFLDQFPKDMAALRNAFAEQDLPTLQRTAHSMKSSCALFGAQPMVDLAITLERIKPAEAWTRAAELIDQLEAEFPLLAAQLLADRR